MLGHLRNVALRFRMQRSSRHKNCRIGGLMFHNQYTNLTPNSTLHGIQQTKYYICSSTYILLADKSANQVLYRVASQIRQPLEHGIDSANGRARSLVFRFIVPDSYQKLSRRQHILLLWCSDTVATMLRPLKSVIRKYISPRINFCLQLPKNLAEDRQTV